MKKFILIITLIYFSSCTTDECSEEIHQENCNDIKVDEEDLYCFKADFENSDAVDGACLPFPTNPDYQKLYFKFVNGLVKELGSSMGSFWDSLGSEGYEFFELLLFQSKKESYTTSETIEVTSGKLSNLDKTIMKSKQTCSYYLYGRYYDSVVSLLEEGNNNNVNKNYEDITDKDICYNARKFNDFKNLIDCGHAEIKLKINDKDFTLKTCYPMPTANLPDLYKKEYSKFQKEFIVDSMLQYIVYAMAGEDINDLGGIFDSRRRRLDSDFSYDITVENKYGRKITFSSKNANSYTVDAKGDPTPFESLEPENGSKSFIGINLILLFLLCLF